ncbi:uncharacterized protein LOC123902488 isoform X2 [Trifolium pratense]|uniref:uncharacterized protein LOC123902488 isoform X2 n=1 Tax=Trifolium pratense TaxID=57577 RepID=UPI001E690022|nr:uncharacterized protein LOC123902488 isoform X2 [Trifolium pratense]
MDTTREELPDTMAAIRLSGMEISDVINELGDLGQEITQGVKSSTRVVRSAEERFRRLTTMIPSSSSASLQGMEYSPKTEPDSGALAVARTARGTREGIIKGRGMLRMFFSLAQFSSFALKFITGHGKRFQMPLVPLAKRIILIRTLMKMMAPMNMNKRKIIRVLYKIQDICNFYYIFFKYYMILLVLH